MAFIGAGLASGTRQRDLFIFPAGVGFVRSAVLFVAGGLPSVFGGAWKLLAVVLGSLGRLPLISTSRRLSIWWAGSSRSFVAVRRNIC